ncbi:CLUMA_CG001099, isoform A [Clunio marinus]|uniref:CLUMA_CG001099, isoform A n=1 Tax=Clunio marinus TaxID=568069 RepID=A0A1J1HM46_9DIPT|nr:CLUMA_CG001099, isoform A [Clunio marinus]
MDEYKKTYPRKGNEIKAGIWWDLAVQGSEQKERIKKTENRKFTESNTVFNQISQESDDLNFTHK